MALRGAGYLIILACALFSGPATRSGQEARARGGEGNLGKEDQEQAREGMTRVENSVGFNQWCNHHGVGIKSEVRYPERG
jgi:hypothetical protein